MRALDSRAPVLKYQAEIEMTGNRQARRGFVELLVELSYPDRAGHLMEKWRIAKFELSERNQAPLRRLTAPSPLPDQAPQFVLEHEAILRLRDFKFPERPPSAPNGPTRVLIFASTLGVGGAERQLAYLLDNLAPNPEFDITLVIFQKVKVETVLEARSRIRVVYVDDIMRQHDRETLSILPRPLLFDVQSILRRQKLNAILNWAAQQRPDVVYHAVGLPTDAIIVGHVLRVPVLAVRFGGVTFRNNFNASDRQYQDQVVAEDCCRVFADRISFITNSQAACDAWSERLGIGADKFDVIPNGSPIPAPAAHSKKAECARLFDDPDVIVVGWVGRFHDVKRPQLWIDVALRMAAEEPALRFLLVGSGPLLQGLRRRVETTPYGDRFLFTGHVSEGLTDMYRAMDILLVTSRTESFPNVVLEALGQGAYVVSAAVGGVPEIVNSDVLGRLVEGDDVEDFAVHMREALADLATIDRDRSRRATIVRNTYSLQSMVSRYAKKFRPKAERSRNEQTDKAPALAAGSPRR
jgi:glycosyltransferase involved in cell wall biosynthesis